MDDPTPTVDAPSKPSLRFRRTRIAVSVFFGLVTVALCVLWVRSCWRSDFIERNDGVFTRIGFASGSAFFYRSESLGRHLQQFDWVVCGTNAHADATRFEWCNSSLGLEVQVPLWFLSIIAVAISTAGVWKLEPPANRFSLRTMLIATTLVAVVLGLGVWLAR